jgi:hypothetical protein
MKAKASGKAAGEGETSKRSILVNVILDINDQVRIVWELDPSIIHLQVTIVREKRYIEKVRCGFLQVACSNWPVGDWMRTKEPVFQRGVFGRASKA